MPKDVYLSSKLVFSEKNMQALEEYLNKIEYCHHLWQPEEEIGDIRKVVMMHKNAKDQQKKVRQSQENIRQAIKGKIDSQFQ